MRLGDGGSLQLYGDYVETFGGSSTEIRSRTPQVGSQRWVRPCKACIRLV